MSDNTLQFAIVCSKISEIAADDKSWQGDDVIAIDESEIAEMTAGDEKPFFVEVTALYEGLNQTKKRFYTEDAVRSCIDAMVGVNMYKGHREPGTESWQYREPVGHIVATKLGRIDLPDRKGVLCAKAKAYITDADPKLRQDIKRKMAGNVSILGNARLVRKMGDDVSQVTKIHSPLASVDFCNPGTAGMAHAGVTAVVAEMDGTTEVVVKDTNEGKETMKLTKEELLTEYKAEIVALVGEQVESEVAEIAAGRKQLAEERAAFKAEKEGLQAKLATVEAQVAEMKQQLEAKEAALRAEADKRVEAELKVFVEAHVAEMKGLDGANERLIDMAAKRTAATLVESDLEKSKVAYTASLKANLADVSQIAEMFGGNGQPATPAGKTKQHNGNSRQTSNGDGDDRLKRIMSPDLLSKAKS